MNHYLPLYFPEAQKYFSSSRAEWFFRMLHMFPSPHYIKAMGKEEFIKKAWKVSGRKVAKEVFLSDFFETAKNSIGIPVLEDSESLVMFRLVLQEALALCEKRQQLEDRAHEFLKQDPQYKILRSIPGIGPIIALTIIAESG
ncbi:MAG: IS110 family transposase, partial [Proteobacteria bacterium]|nr:IS110 family transposase [Pseudomonadota bacterium]